MKLFFTVAARSMQSHIPDLSLFQRLIDYGEAILNPIIGISYYQVKGNVDSQLTAANLITGYQQHQQQPSICLCKLSLPSAAPASSVAFADAFYVDG